MEHFNIIILSCLIIFFLLDILKEREIHSNIKMNILAIINLMFISAVIFLLLNKLIFSINYYTLLLVPLGVLSLYYQYKRYNKSKESSLNKYIKIIFNYIFILIIFFMLKF